jgi:hypothetical protein
LLRILALGRKQMEEGEVKDHDDFFASLDADDEGIVSADKVD